MNGTVHPATTHQGGIGCVDDHVNVHRRDIAMNNVDLRSHKHPLQPAFFTSVSQREKEKNCREKRRLAVIHLNDRKRFLFIQVFHADSGQS